MKVSQTFCAYPFVHQYFNLNGKVSVCCYNPDGYQSDNGNLVEQFNSDRMNELRSDMLNGKRNSICNHCYDLEDREIVSPRQTESKVWFSKDFHRSLEENIELAKNNQPLIPISHDIRFSNTCSLKCKTCIPQNSSAINAENIKFEKENVVPILFDKSMMFTSIENQNKNQVDDVPVNEKTKWIYLVGGEPLVEEKNTELLEKVANLKIDPVIVINTSMARKNNKLKDVLKNFTKVNYVVSIDAYGKLNDYIRSGSHWETVLENLNSVDPKEISGFNTVVSMYNIFSVGKLIEWISNNYPGKHHFISRAVYHEPTELQNVPYLLRENIIKNFENLYKQYNYVGLQNIATFLQENNYSESGFNKFLEFTRFLDIQRKESIHDVEPLWSSYFT